MNDGDKEQEETLPRCPYMLSIYQCRLPAGHAGNHRIEVGRDLSAPPMSLADVIAGREPK